MKHFDDLSETKLSEKLLYDGAVLHVGVDDVRLPNGKDAKREYIRHVGAVCILPLRSDGCVLIERQFRYPVNSVICEIPAGKLDSKSEDRLSAAKRELAEETGIIASKWTNMGDFYPAAAYTDEKLTIYLAEDLKTERQNLDDDEFLNLEWVPFKTLFDDVMAGKIPDAKTQLSVLKLAVLRPDLCK